ncbi:MAG: hypothetical protein ABI273_05205 [Lacunisphaera sp.]
MNGTVGTAVGTQAINARRDVNGGLAHESTAAGPPLLHRDWDAGGCDIF